MLASQSPTTYDHKSKAVTTLSSRTYLFDEEQSCSASPGVVVVGEFGFRIQAAVTSIVLRLRDWGWMTETIKDRESDNECERDGWATNTQIGVQCHLVITHKSPSRVHN